MRRLGIVAVLALLLAAWVGWREWQARNAEPAGRAGRGQVAVEVAPVRRATIRDTGRFSGSLHPRSSFLIAPRVGGRLERLHVDIGDTIRHGDLLAVLDSEEYTQQVHQAEAELEVARANAAEALSALAIAQREWDRVATLRNQAIASESELDAAQARYDAADARAKVAQSQVRQREAGLQAARIRLSYTRIFAEWENGDRERVVGERFVHEAAVLRPNDPIVSILDIGVLTAVVHAIERDYPKLAVGQIARVTTDAWPGESFAGTVTRVAPLIREASRQARVEISVANDGLKLRPGMFIRAEIVFSVHADACVVPVGALVRRDGREGVFQPDPERGIARFVPVVTGIRDRDQVQILEPRLSNGVITLGQHLLDHGSGIAIASPLKETVDCGADGAAGTGDEG